MSANVTGFYNQNPEKEKARLENPYSKIEFATTLHQIEKYFPPSGNICDIGGGPGRYSFDLLRKGYSVTLVDVSSELLEIARKERDKIKIRLQIIQADGQDLHMLLTESYHAILLMGPLYHLLEKKQRLACLGEAFRLLKKGGIAIVAYLNAWGIARYGIGRFPKRYDDLNFIRSMQHEVVLKDSFENFTECFWSTPPAAMKEIQEAGFEIISRAGSESFASGMKDAVIDMAENSPLAYQNLLEACVETCEAEQYRDATEHLHFIVKKR